MSSSAHRKSSTKRIFLLLITVFAAVACLICLYNGFVLYNGRGFMNTLYLGDTSSSITYKDIGDGRVMPVGPPSDRYLNHLWQTLEYNDVFPDDSGWIDIDIQRRDLKLAHSRVRESKIAWGLRNAWLARVYDFRKILERFGLNNFVEGRDLKSAPFRNIESMKSSEFKTPNNFTNVPDDIATVRGMLFDTDWPIINAREEAIFQYSCCDNSKLKNNDLQLVVDFSVVIPVNAQKFNLSWPTFESLRQLVVFPKEVIVLLTGIESVRHSGLLLGYISILDEVYRQSLPSGCTMKVFVSRKLYKPNDNRWFGFNQTSTSVVTFFDGDDYMHPQMFQILDHVFKKRPELEFCLIGYKSGAMTGEFHGSIYNEYIVKYLQNYRYSPEAINSFAQYSVSEYESVRKSLPTWNKTWYLGDTDSEPNWGGESQRWWDGRCHNGWITFVRKVIELVPPPTDYYGGEDAIFNYRVLRAGFNYHCLRPILGMYLKNFSKGDNTQLWALHEYSYVNQ